MNRRLYRSLHLTLLFVILASSAFLAAPSTLASESGPVDIDKPRRGFDPMPEYSEPPVTSAVPDEGQVIPTNNTWRYFAFQSFRDGNWEVYRKDLVDNNDYRITNNPNYDGEPRISPAGDQMVYTSIVDERNVLFTVRMDGTGARPLTGDRKKEMTPSFSPDGKKIIYSREDQKDWNLYLINADGTNQAAFYTDPTTIDVFPSWSADGKKIAFVRLDSLGYGAIWIINIDGTGLKQLSVPLRYLQTPLWSPDGTQISFDADMDWDGWNEIGLINADGSDMRILRDESTNSVDLWNGSWSYGGNMVMLTRLDYVLYQNQYYLDSLKISSQVVNLNYFLDVPGNYEANPEFVSMDKKPPIIHLESIPEYSVTKKIDWDMVDHASGPYLLYLERREGDTGEWGISSEAKMGESLILSGNTELRYFFRAYAYDNAGNRSPYTTPFEVTFYEYKISGRVLDNRGLAVPDANIIVQPRPLKALESDSSGHYEVYRSFGGQATVQAAGVGYESMSPMVFNLDSDITTDLYLKPSDDLVENGDFEATPDGLAGWTATTAMKTAKRYQESDQKAAILGFSCPTGTCMEASYDVARSTTKKYLDSISTFAADNLGRIHYIDWDNHSFNLFYSRRDVDGTWSDQIYLPRFSHEQYIAGSPKMMIDTNNDIYLVTPLAADYQNNGGNHIVIYKYSNLTGQWSEPQWVDEGIEPDLVMDKNGRLIISYLSFTNVKALLLKIQSTTGEWKDAVTIANDININIDLAVDFNNTIHFLFRKLGKTRHQAWSEGKGLIKVDPLKDEFRASYLFVDPTNTLYSFGDQSYYLTLSPDGSWVEHPIYMPKGSEVAMDGMGNIYVFYREGGAATNYVFQNYLLARTGGRWSEPGYINQSAIAYYGIIANPQVGFHLFEDDRKTANFKHFAGYSPAPDTEYRLEQQISIPADLNRPTLTFWYELSNAEPQAPSRLVVEVDDQGTVTELFATTTPNPGEFLWFDLQPWAGKTVTLKAYLERSSGTVLRYAYLDEISIGSWVTPVAASISHPVVELGSAGMVLTIDGENFLPGLSITIGGAPAQNVEWVSSTRVRFALPAGLSAGKYNVKVTNPQGVSGYVPGALQVGNILLIPGINR